MKAVIGILTLKFLYSSGGWRSFWTLPKMDVKIEHSL